MAPGSSLNGPASCLAYDPSSKQRQRVLYFAQTAQKDPADKIKQIGALPWQSPKQNHFHSHGAYTQSIGASISLSEPSKGRSAPPEL